jgi:hypothetical protein
LDTVTALQRVAVHVVARARVQATGRFSLRVSPGGFATPDFGDGPQRVRVAGGTLLAESDRRDQAAVRTRALDGASLADLAALAGVDLGAALDVGHDTPPLSDPAEPIRLDEDGARRVHRAHSLGAAALDLLVAGLPAASAPTLARLWPEHFDVALDAGARSGVRINLGVSPGDGYLAEPYAYAGPWTDARPGRAGFWNAPFGAARPLSDLGDDASGIAAFLREGYDRLAAG